MFLSRYTSSTPFLGVSIVKLNSRKRGPFFLRGYWGPLHSFQAFEAPQCRCGSSRPECSTPHPLPRQTNHPSFAVPPNMQFFQCIMVYIPQWKIQNPSSYNPMYPQGPRGPPVLRSPPTTQTLNPKPLNPK